MRLFAAALLLFAAPAFAAFDWSADLAVLQREVPKVHPDAFHNTTRVAFDTAVARLRERAPSMEPSDVAAEVARIMATLGDGHTRLTLPVDPNAGFFLGHTATQVPEIRFSTLPARFFIYDDGVYVTSAADPALVGRRVLRIGSKPIGEAMQLLAPYAAAENESGRRNAIGDLLAVPAMLDAAGISDAARVELAVDGGTFALEPVAYGTPLPWLQKNDPRPFYLERRGNIAVMVFNEVANGKEETLAAFARRLEEEAKTADAVVIDARENRGGNGSLNRGLIHALIRSPRLQEPGRLFLLMGRRTFSAALFLALDLEQQTNAIFAGEPLGARPNSYGDSRKTLLPSSGLTLRISTLYWQKSDPRDKRDAVAPHLAVPLLAKDRGRDAAFEKVQSFVAALARGGELAGRNWSGTISLEYQRVPLTIANGRLTAKEIGLENVELQGVVREGNRVRFRAGNYAFNLRVGDGVIAGTFSAGGVEYLVVMQGDR
ncbi:MAG TPA: hypothetical protein VF618_20380 [Thermoanaerobaculia bacterium]